MIVMVSFVLSIAGHHHPLTGFSLLYGTTERMNITNEKEALDKVLAEIEDALQSKDFLSGRSEPSLGDLAVYGALRSIEGLPAHDRILNGNAERPLRLWYDRTKAKVMG
eukprot:scaffold227_cov165-Amphora_coffeaeformis.AAC.28